jgi:Eukaryotic-type DNA primase, large subunit
VPVCLSAVGLPLVSSRVIIGMRNYFEDYLNSLEDEALVVEAERMDLKISHDRERHNFRISTYDFTRYCSRISGSEYRLALQTFDKGDVLSGRNSVSKMLRESFVSDMRERVNTTEKDRSVEVMRDYSRQILEIRSIGEEMSKSMDLGAVDSNLFPPCIRHYITDIQASVNLPHIARFTLVSFLHNVGMEEGEVMNIFSNVPDFSKKITEYQVKHIIGEISGTEYSPPKCATIRSNHQCYQGDDPVCAMENMKHPLSYYKIKKFKKKER